MPYLDPIYRDPLDLLSRVRDSALGGPGPMRLPVSPNPVLLRGGAPQMVPPVDAPRNPSLLERLFPASNEYAGLLSPEAIQGARKQQLLQLGIGLLANSGPRVRGTPGSSFGERIGAALQQMPNWNEMLANLAQQRVALMGKQGAVKTVDAGDRVLFYDERGNVVSSQPKGATPSSNDNTTQEYATRASTLRGQFLTQTANERAVAQAYQAVQAADQSPAGDIALVYGFMKMVDPTSAVREGEFATAQNAGSVPERVRAMYNRALKGERLTDTVRADFVRQATNRARQSRQSLLKVIEDYQRRAKRIAVDPQDAAYDYFTGYDLSDSQAPTPQPGSPRPPLQFRVPQ